MTTKIKNSSKKIDSSKVKEVIKDTNSIAIVRYNDNTLVSSKQTQLKAGKIQKTSKIEYYGLNHVTRQDDLYRLNELKGKVITRQDINARDGKFKSGKIVISSKAQSEVFNRLGSMFPVNFVNYKNKKVMVFSGRHVMVIHESDINLKLSPSNGKIKQQGTDYNLKAGVFDLLSGITCPAALHCKQWIVTSQDIHVRRKQASKDLKYSCFATKAESQYVDSFFTRLVNWLILQVLSENEIAEALSELIKVNKINLLRFHGSGDFFHKKYFNASVEVARLNPTILFYGYTKMLPYKLTLDKANLDNYGLIYSDGGVFDDKAESLKVNRAFVCDGKYWQDNKDGTMSRTSDGMTVKFACVTKQDDFKFILAGKSLGLHLH